MIGCTLYNEQCTVYSVQCTVYSVQYTVYSVQCTMDRYCIRFGIIFRNNPI